ncbi:hypothetical protein EV649_8100 [Kribbella sp. VKM Ac-2569]|uniref:hypothetical protein n=1 Tax=Kribbella sp. VKM Ac-2569 TaxID=2512220 RepID=UPI00102BA1D8|nr:hypothetical protein [Kribbella sp. VKM Ac-2569]RZT07394.1 hypothetical protein EV649_8100 [Kribbella sp. VKM Ac-2569]
MPSELQRVARGLVDCFDEIPRVVDQLLRTAARCRENAQVALIASRGQATVAAQQLDAAARACEAAAHFLSMAPPKARGWAEGLIGTPGPSTNRPSSDSADRNKSTSGTSDVQVRTRRLTATYDELEVAEDNEPPLVTVARKAFEKYRKAYEEDDQERDDENLLELEITVTETGEVLFEEPDEKEEDKRAERLARDFEIDPDLTEAVKLLLDSMTEADADKWQHATLTITPTHIEVAFGYPEQPTPAPLIVDVNLPDLPTPNLLDFDPALDLRPLGSDFAPGVHDPQRRFLAKERKIAERLEGEGWRVDARPEDHGSGQKNPDAVLRRSGSDEGAIVEFKTQDVDTSSAVKRNILTASGQAIEAAAALRARHEVVIDGRPVGLSEDTALRSFRRALGQPGATVAPVVHVILGDGRMVTFTKEQ